MVHAAHASRYHWGRVGTPLNLERGEWQVSRVYTTLVRAEPALYHTRRCLDICQADAIDDSDIAFAHEAVARAYAVTGDRAQAERYLALGRAALAGIKEDGDREYARSQLDSMKLPRTRTARP